MGGEQNRTWSPPTTHSLTHATPDIILIVTVLYHIMVSHSLSHYSYGKGNSIFKSKHAEKAVCITDLRLSKSFTSLPSTASCYFPAALHPLLRTWHPLRGLTDWTWGTLHWSTAHQNFPYLFLPEQTCQALLYANTITFYKCNPTQRLFLLGTRK